MPIAGRIYTRSPEINEIKMDQKHLDVNKELWNKKTPIHLESEFYDMKGFLAGETSLKEIELGLLGDISGKSILHLQCHFGQDSLSLSRMGAQVTGVDISDVAISKAKELATQLGIDANFVCCDLYSAKEHITEKFDIVFTSYGTIGWLPDMDKCADVVAHFLKPEGTFIMVDLHPVVWMYNETFKEVEFSYFNVEAIVEQSPGTYAQQDAEIDMQEVGWNHSFGEIFNALMNKHLTIKHFEEYDYSPHNCFKGMVEKAPGQFIIETHGSKLPMCYSIMMEFK